MLCVAIIAIEGPVRNMSTRWIAAEKMIDAWTGFATDKFARTPTCRAKVVTLRLGRVLTFY